MAAHRTTIIQERAEAARMTLLLYYLDAGGRYREDLYLCGRCGAVLSYPLEDDPTQFVITCPCCGALNES